MHRLGDDMDAAAGLEVPKLTDDVRRRLSVSVTDIGGSRGYLVPLENLEVATSHFEFVPGDRRPVMRFCGWTSRVSADGTLVYGSTGVECAPMLERVSAIDDLLDLPVDAREGRTSQTTKQLRSERAGLTSRVDQIGRMKGRALSREEAAVFDLLPLDIGSTLPAGLTPRRAEQVLSGLRARGWVTTEDRIVWRPDNGCLWFKNALIGRRYCLHCLVELGRKCREIETGRPRQRCPRCGKENPYIGQSLPKSFSYYAQEESLTTAHVTRSHRNSPLARLADAHKRALLVDKDVFNLRLPRDAYGERALVDGDPNPISRKGVERVIYRWSQGWVPFACRAPVTGMVTNVYVDEASTALTVEVGSVAVQFEPYWVPTVASGQWVNEGDELVIPMARPELRESAGYWGLSEEVQRYLWTHVGEASWLVIEPAAENGAVLDRRRAARLSGMYRTLYPVAILKPEHLGRVYVDTRGCTLDRVYAVDAGVLRRGHLGDVRLNLDALIGSCYDFYHCEQRLAEEGKPRGRKKGKAKRRRQRQPSTVPSVPAPGPVTLDDGGDGLGGDEPVVLEPESFATSGTPSMKVEVKHEHTDTGGAEQPAGVDGGDTAGTDAGAGLDRESSGPEARSGAGPDRAEETGTPDGCQGEGSAGAADPAGHADGEAVLGPDLEAGSPDAGGSNIGAERELAGVPANVGQGNA